MTALMTLRRMAARIIPAVMLAAVIPLMGGCDASSEVVEPEVSSAIYHAGFTVTLQQPTSTRSTPEGDYDPGSGYENYIDLDAKDYRVFFFDKDDTFVGSFDKHNIVPISETETSKTYFIMGQLEPELVVDNTLSLKIMMLANWGGYPEPVKNETKLTEIAKDATNLIEFDPESDTVVDADHTIPMAGISNFKEKVPFNEKKYLNFGTIHMLRAYAKVEVINSENSVLNIENVRLSRVNTQAYALAQGVTKESDYKHDNYEGDYTLSPSIPSTTVKAENVHFTRTASGSYVIYVPEFANLASKDNPLHYNDQTQILVKFEESSVEIPIFFRKYVSGLAIGDHFDVMRNYWYKYTITKHFDQIEVEVDVVPYIRIDLKPGFGFDEILPGDHDKPNDW